MSAHATTPDAIRWDNITPTSVRLSWRVQDDAVAYEVSGGGTDMVRRVSTPYAVIKGLLASDVSTLKVRSVGANGDVSAWGLVDVITSVGAPVAPAHNGVFPVQDLDNQSFRIRLPDSEGYDVECLLHVWWQPSDEGWWASLEAPIGTPIVRGRRLCVNGGLLDGLFGVVSGNIVMRPTAERSTAEPRRDAFAKDTHQLRWEGV